MNIWGCMKKQQIVKYRSGHLVSAVHCSSLLQWLTILLVCTVIICKGAREAEGRNLKFYPWSVNYIRRVAYIYISYTWGLILAASSYICTREDIQRTRNVMYVASGQSVISFTTFTNVNNLTKCWFFICFLSFVQQKRILIFLNNLVYMHPQLQLKKLIFLLKIAIFATVIFGI